MPLLSGPNFVNQQRNPLLNVMSVPTGSPFGSGRVTNAFNTMNRQMPAAIGGGGGWGKMNPQAQGALQNNINQLHQSQFDQNKISLLRNPITTAGPQAQLKAQAGAAEQGRDLESLSNIYLQNAFGALSHNTDRITMMLKLLMGQ